MFGLLILSFLVAFHCLFCFHGLIISLLCEFFFISRYWIMFGVFFKPVVGTSGNGLENTQAASSRSRMITMAYHFLCM